VDLKTALRHFLDFRFQVLTRRLEYDLEQLEKRIHILKGFAIIFNGLDEAIKIIRASSNKADAAQRLMHRFRLDELQTDAILETKLYRLSQLEIDDILKELEDKQEKAAVLRELLANETARHRLVREELKDLKNTFGDERRTVIAGPDPERSFSAEDYIVSEDVSVIITRDGWVKRQRSYSDLSSIRVREGDQVGWVMESSTRATVCFFTNFGRVYTTRVDDLPNTTGYGAPVQKLFDFTDKESVVGVVSCDPRLLPKSLPEPDLEPQLFTNGNGHAEADEPSGPYIFALTNVGFCVRVPLEVFSEPSTKNGRLYMRLEKSQHVLGADVCRGDEKVCIATWQGRALIFPVQQVSVLKGAGKGVVAIRLDKADRVIGFALSSAARQGLEVETNRGRTEVIRPTKFEISNRGNKGRVVIQRGNLKALPAPTIELTLP
jgi:DNA gyrase subunit A